MDNYDELIGDLELYLTRTAKVDVELTDAFDKGTRDRLLRLPIRIDKADCPSRGGRERNGHTPRGGGS